jgi:23S rRNA (uracil1939-C5)-methyltransferase
MHPGDVLALEIEKAAAGGRMLARHEGQVALVAGAIPGERVSARVEREQRGVIYATTIDVDRPHPARRAPLPDSACGGMSYSHIAPEHQRTLKADVVADAFARIGKLALLGPVEVAASPERGYRMRARVHLRQGRLGSFREGTHDICDYAQTGQVLEATAAVLAELAARLSKRAVSFLDAIEIAENLPGQERVVHVEPGPGGLDGTVLGELAATPSLSGLTILPRPGARPALVSGRPTVSDRLDAFVPALEAPAAGCALARHATSFFQANRFLAPTLVQRVLGALRPGRVVDLYAGVGLFAVCAAAAGAGEVTAVEGDRGSAADLRANAAPFRERLRVEARAVEDFLASRGPGRPASLIVDPPRTGISREAMAGVLASAAERIVYVSCDVATLARDAGRLVAAGYGLVRVEAFDLFPNTPHIEALAVFDRL